MRVQRPKKPDFVDASLGTRNRNGLRTRGSTPGLDPSEREQHGRKPAPRELFVAGPSREIANAEPAQRRFCRDVGNAAVQGQPETGYLRQPGTLPAFRFEHHVAPCQTAQCGLARPVRRLPADPLQFTGQQMPWPGGDRPETQLVVKPPRTGCDAFLVALAQLVGFDRERARAEDVAGHCQHTAEQSRRLGAAKRGKHVERHFGAGQQTIGLDIADRHPVAQHQPAMHGRQRQTAFGHRTDQGKGQAVAIIDQAHIAFVAP